MPRHKANKTTPVSALEKKLEEVRASRELAESENSFGAVSAMHRLEVDIVRAMWEREAALEAERRREAEEAQAAADPTKLIASLRDALFALPLPLRERLLQQIAAMGLN
jgi:hypothetical protein